MIRQLAKDDAEVLKQVAKPVTEITDEIRQLAKDMLDTMYANNGIGLAANQVSVLKRVIVVDLARNGRRCPVVMINPEITKARGKQVRVEGCLSYPGRQVAVTRAAQIRVKYLNEFGGTSSMKCDSLFAQAVQHEIDHLNGTCAVGMKRKAVERMPEVA